MALNLEATVEPDADGDGWGDEAQDRCVEVPGPEQGCPASAPSTSAPRLKVELNVPAAQAVLAQGGIRLTLRANQPAGYTASGVLHLSGAKAPPTLRQTVGQIGADRPLRVKLKLTRRAEQALRKGPGLRSRADVRIQVDVTGEDGREVTVTSKLEVRAI